MDKSKSMKKAIIALLIFGLIAVVCWAAFFVIFALNEKLLVIHLAQVLAMFMPWKLDMAHYLPNSIAVLGVVLSFMSSRLERARILSEALPPPMLMMARLLDVSTTLG